MAAFEAMERLQKFDWLIQKLHSLRTSLQAEPGLSELQQLHALQLLQRNAGFNGSSIGESEEEDKMELCKLEGEDIEEDIVDTEEEEEELDGDEPVLQPGVEPQGELVEKMEDIVDNELEEQSEEREEEVTGEGEEQAGLPQGPYSRFPTSHLFPPLPFDNLLPLIGDDTELKVGGGWQPGDQKCSMCLPTRFG